MSILIRLLTNILGLYLAHRFVDGFTVVDGWQAYLVAALVLAVLNWIVRPILKIITFPLVIISLGLFLIVINAIILWLTAELTGYLIIDGYVPLLLATLIIAVLNFVAKPLR